MGANTKIEWAHHTFNIVWGCEKRSPACANCYAEAFSKRLGMELWGPNTPRRVMSDAYWLEPLKWNEKAKQLRERQRVFCSSMADVFEDHPTVNEQRERMWPLIQATPWLDWLLLTKRPENFRRFLPWDADDGIPWGNVWGGVTAENQEWLDRRAPLLLNARFAVRFISGEPLLGVMPRLAFYLRCPACRGEKHPSCRACFGRDRLDWVICGGESGHGARPMEADWARQVRDQCQEAGVPFFFKQHGEWLGGIRVGKGSAGRELDGRTWDEVPEGRAAWCPTGTGSASVPISASG